MSIPAGWYPDPHPDAHAGGLRWWDGNGWSDHTDAGTAAQPAPQPPAQQPPAQQPPAQQPPAPQPPAQQPPAQQPPAQQGSTEQVQAQPRVGLEKAATGEAPVHPQQQPGYPQQPGYAQQPLPGYPPQQQVAVPQMTHCPDGATIASPWARLGAAVLDGLIAFVVTLVILLVVGAVLGGGALALFAAGSDSDGSVDGPAGVAGVALVVLLYMLILALSLLYTLWAFVLRVRTHGASPGKQMLGLRIRTFHADGQLTYGQVWGRVGLPQLASMVTFGISSFVDVIWLLFDRHVQCLHDKAVGTVVVNTRLPLAPPDHPGVQLARSFPAARGWVADGPVPPGTTSSSLEG